MLRPRLLFGALHPDFDRPFLLLPDENPGGSPPAAPPAAPAPAPTPTPSPPDKGFPDDKPVADMTVEQREAYWKHQARKHEERSKADGEWRKAHEAKVKQYDALEAASKTEQEKAVEAARNEAVKAGRAEAVPQILAAELRASSGGTIDVEAAQKRVQYLDRNAFLGTDGTVDMTKVGEWVKDQVGEQPAPGTRRLPEGFPPLPQGQHGNQPVTGKDAGLAEARKRFGDPAKQSA